MVDQIKERFLRYVKIDTQSDEKNTACPSTEKQWNLARLLCQELKDIGLQEVDLDENGYIMAKLPANTSGDIPVIGFISHMDTSPDMSGKDVNPQFVEKYDGSDILLNKQDNIVLSPVDFPELLQYIGQALITTDGTTLLGADDKAGVAAIVSAMDYLVKHPEIKHGEIKVGFTPDEEIGRGADLFDVAKFGAEYAYTIDGGQIGELEYENFNAAVATIEIQGRNVHPGTAKNQMINALHLAMELNAMLPAQQRPEYTAGYEGFYHLIDLSGEVEHSSMRYIIRDHDSAKFSQKKDWITNVVNLLNQKYNGRIKLEIKDQYYNMREKVEPVMHIVDTAEEAMKICGVKPIIKPIRGGTDGCRLSYMGLPCPNIFAGGHNFHGKYEFIPVPSMHKAVEVITKICELVALKAQR
ncbi:MAG: peptidase T [Cyclobacteriaceae bacterium]